MNSFLISSGRVACAESGGMSRRLGFHTATKFRVFITAAGRRPDREEDERLAVPCLGKVEAKP